MYEISYTCPLAGSFSVSVLVDENAFDSDDNYLHVRGSPFAIDVDDSWAELSVSGSAPAGKDRLRLWQSSCGNKAWPEWATPRIPPLHTATLHRLSRRFCASSSPQLLPRVLRKNGPFFHIQARAKAIGCGKA